MNQTYFSMTSLGPIPHRRYHGFRLPVKLDTSKTVLTSEGNKYPPLSRNGNLVWALPNGGEIVFDDDE